MDNYALVIDISSDEEKHRYSTPIKTLPVNMVGRLNLSDSSVEVWRGSEADLNSTQESVSTFESDTEEAFVVESHQKENSEDYYEQPDSSREMPELTRAPVLADITNKKEFVPPSKTEKLNDIDEPSIKEIEETHGLSMTEDYYCTAGRGIHLLPRESEEHENNPYLSLERSHIAPGRGQQAIEAPCHDPLPVGIFPVAEEYRSLQEGEDMAILHKIR